MMTYLNWKLWRSTNSLPNVATKCYTCKCNARTTAAATWTRVCVGSSDIQPNPACAKISTQFPIALLHELCWCRGCKGKAMPRLVAPCLSRKFFDTILQQETIYTAGGVPLHIHFLDLFWVPVNSPKCQLMSAGTGPWHWHVTVNGRRNHYWCERSNGYLCKAKYSSRLYKAKHKNCANRTSFMWVKDSYWSFVTVLTACHQQSSPSPGPTDTGPGMPLAPSPESSDWWWTYAKFCCSCREWKTIINSLWKGKRSLFLNHFDSIYVVRAPLMLSNVLFDVFFRFFQKCCKEISVHATAEHKCMQYEPTPFFQHRL